MSADYAARHRPRKLCITMPVLMLLTSIAMPFAWW